MDLCTVDLLMAESDVSSDAAVDCNVWTNSSCPAVSSVWDSSVLIIILVSCNEVLSFVVSLDMIHPTSVFCVRNLVGNLHMPLRIMFLYSSAPSIESIGPGFLNTGSATIRFVQFPMLTS